MGTRFRLLTAGAAVLGLFALATPAWGMGQTVCAKGCAFTKIQAAIEAASSGATITIGKGSYFENVVVNKPLTLTGSGKSSVIYPALDEPTCEGGSLCEGKASNIVLVEASDVTITNLQLNGDNPNITSSVVVGGADISARNGIITNHLKGVPYMNLTVSNVKVLNVYLRGIYASTSGGTFNFNHDQVSNVQGEEASVAMFAFENSGVMESNKVSEANDAISENWSKGSQFLNNTIKNSGSGVHSDNNGGAGGVADVIAGNKVSSCKPNGYGVFVFAPYVAATVENNKIKGCAVGLAVFGSQPGETSSVSPTFANNMVSGAGASTTEPGGTVGALLTTDLLGFGHADVMATLTHNRIERFGTGVIVTQTKPTNSDTAGGQATVIAHDNTIAKDGIGADGETGTVFEAQNSWWGCPQGPNMSPKCDSAVGTTSSTPWLTSKP
jgi:nitrous oxidase accessory protein NosD